MIRGRIRFASARLSARGTQEVVVIAGTANFAPRRACMSRQAYCRLPIKDERWKIIIISAVERVIIILRAIAHHYFYPHIITYILPLAGSATKAPIIGTSRLNNLTWHNALYHTICMTSLVFVLSLRLSLSCVSLCCCLSLARNHTSRLSVDYRPIVGEISHRLNSWPLSSQCRLANCVWHLARRWTLVCASERTSSRSAAANKNAKQVIWWTRIDAKKHFEDEQIQTNKSIIIIIKYTYQQLHNNRVNCPWHIRQHTQSSHWLIYCSIQSNLISCCVNLSFHFISLQNTHTHTQPLICTNRHLQLAIGQLASPFFLPTLDTINVW